MATISYYGSHNAAIVVENEGKILCVLEVERFTNYKNCGIAQYKPAVHVLMTLEECLKFIQKEYGIYEYDVCYFASTDVTVEDFERVHILFRTEFLIPAKEYIHVSHHLSHAYNVFYQSPHKEALVFSFDGGGDDGEFNVYHAKRGEEIKELARFLNPIKNNPHIYYNLGFAYMVFGHFFADIRLEQLGEGNLVYPGKIMGLCSYGNVRNEWLDDFIEFYKSDPDGGNADYQVKLNILGEKIGVVFDLSNRLEGQIAYDVAATSQRAFEECFLENVKPFMEEYPDLPICMAGGCALNIILNTRLVEEFNKDVFVGPNPNDCGIALGMMLKHLKPEEAYDATYAGIPILDKYNLANISFHYRNVRSLMPKTEKYHAYEQWDPSILVDDLERGKIVGVVRGNSEHGPRALGNRSIICNPAISDMKDILNEKVKHREWYRPFAPVVRLEDVSEYFEWDRESRWMSFCPKVKEEWREKLPAITHVDNTARVQTVTREQNEWLYDLLTNFKEKTGIGVLLNTSFNVNGKPILSTYKDAFHIYDTTDIDGLIIEHLYIRKENYVDF
jgi:carbamoyltransferase